jgi:ParB-like nuclease domain
MDTSSPKTTTAHNLTSIFSEVDPHSLKPHPHNVLIYGENEDVTELVNLIHNSQHVRPLIINNQGVIISGHRRLLAVLKLGWKTVPVEIREFSNKIAELHTLLLENANRGKTREQKVREAAAWLELETLSGRKRMGNAKKNRATNKITEPFQGVENFPHLGLGSTKGKTRDNLAKRVGLGSGRTYSKAAKVVEFIDEQANLGKLELVEELRQTLNCKSVDAAYKLLELTKKCPPSNEDSQPKRSLFEIDEIFPQSIAKSCWNCQHKVESHNLQSINCNKFGILNLIDKSGNDRGRECQEWRNRYSPTAPLKKPSFALQILLPLEWQDQLEQVTASLNTDVATWVTKLIGTTLFPNSDLDEPSHNQSSLLNSEILYAQVN